jgi:hypothetical protein
VRRDLECLEVFRAVNPFTCKCIIGEGQAKDMQDGTKGKIIISFIKYEFRTIYKYMLALDTFWDLDKLLTYSDPLFLLPFMIQSVTIIIKMFCEGHLGSLTLKISMSLCKRRHVAILRPLEGQQRSAGST